MASPAAILSVLVRADTGNATRGLLRFNTQLGNTEKKSNKALGAVKTLAKGSAIGAGLGFGYAVKKAADFEQQLDSLASVSGATGRQMERLSKQAMKAGADTKFSALDAAEAQTELAKGGLRVQQIMKGGLRSALALAAAGEMDLADAASTTANAMNLFGLRGHKAMKVADALATAANATTADVSDFAMALSQGGSVAKMAGLSFNETVLALEALAKSGIKNSDAGTSLKTSLIQLLKPTAKQAELAEKLNLTFIDSHGNFKSMADVSDMLRKRLGDMTAAQRAAALATLAGTDGVRTLTSLYAAGPEKLNKWSKGLDKSGTAAKVAAEKEDNLRGKLENLQGSLETVSIAAGSKFLPALTDAAKAITDLVNNPNLSAQEKLDKFGKMFGDALAAIGPKVAKAAGALGLTAMRGFFSAFRDSPMWFKLITAGFLMSKLGVFGGLWKKAGVAAGAEMASGVAEGGAAATAPGKFAKMGGAMKLLGKRVLGVALVAGIADAITAQGMNLTDRVQLALSDITLNILPPPKDQMELWAKAVDQIKSGKLVGPRDLIDTSKFDEQQHRLFSGMVNLRKQADRMFGPGERLVDKAWASPDHAIKQLRSLVNEFGRMRSGAVLSVKDLRQVTSSNFKAIAETMGVHSARGKAAVDQNFKQGLRIIRGFMKDGTISTKVGMTEVARLLKVHSGAGKASLKTNFKEARDFIAATMRNSKGITKEGMSAIRRIFAQELRLYGLSDEAIKFRLQGKEGSGKTIGAPLVGKRTGGVIVPGRGSGDKVPALLEPGEVVWNREAVSSLFGNSRKANAVNKLIPRFASGGVAGLQPGISRLVGSTLGQWPGLSVTSTTGGTHAPGSYHYRGLAADLASGNYKYMNQAAAWVRGHYGRSLTEGIHNPNLSVKSGKNVSPSFWGASTWANHANHIHLAVAGALKAMGMGSASIGKLQLKGGEGGALNPALQAGLGAVRGAANRRLRQLTAAVAPDSGFSGGVGGGFPKSRLKSLWVRAGGDPGISNLMAAIALAESGGNPMAHNPSGASGLWQILGQIVPGNVFNPMVNAKNAVAKYRSQGLGAWEAYTNGNYRQYLQRGGIARLQKGTGHGDPMSQLPTTIRNQEYNRTTRRMKLPGLLRHTLDILRGPGKKARSRTLHKLLNRIKGVGLPKELNTAIKDLTDQAATYEDYAARAGALTTDDGQGGTVQGMVNGKNEAGWLEDQLAALFKLRNKLVRAVDLITKKREQMAKLIEQARKRLHVVAESIRVAAKRRNALEAQLKQLRKHPHKNKDAIKAVKDQLDGIDKAQGSRGRERKLLHDRIIPALTSQRRSLDPAELMSTLQEVQGLGSPMGHLSSLPAVGVLGGSIFGVQMRLKDLNAPPTTVTDTDQPGIAEALELVRQANQRTAVSQAQYDVFRNMPQFGGGGVVGGVSGAPMPVVAHAGEGVFTPDQMRAMGGGGDLYITVNGDITNVPRGKRPIEVRDIRGLSRDPLPGRGGGITRNG